MVRVNASAAAIFDEYTDQVDLLAQTYDDAFRQSQTARQQLLQLRPFLEKVAYDPTLAKDPATAGKLLAYAVDNLKKSLNAFSDAESLVSTRGQSAGAMMLNLGTWIADRSNVDQQTGEELVRKIYAIRDRHKDLLKGIDAYLNINGPDLARSEPDLAAALSSSTTAAEQAKALLNYLDVWQPAVQTYASPQALVFMDSAINMFRQIGQIMEPIVYEAPADPTGRAYLR
jgi:hypothetical protein